MGEIEREFFLVFLFWWVDFRGNIGGRVGDKGEVRNGGCGAWGGRCGGILTG